MLFYFHLRLSVFAFLVPVMQDLKDACVISMCICSVICSNFCFHISSYACRTMIHHWYGLVLWRHCRVICWCLKLSAHDWRAECCTVGTLNRAKKKIPTTFFFFSIFCYSFLINQSSNTYIVSYWTKQLNILICQLLDLYTHTDIYKGFFLVKKRCPEKVCWLMTIALTS